MAQLNDLAALFFSEFLVRGCELHPSLLRIEMRFYHLLFSLCLPQSPTPFPNNP
uniref:Uncharacterized protein n=1 Tax=Nelumbo nucifera TaxID=4432 RepID=A0A822YR40_NELNU|nr:TPA_asm: hypothetical protein HUJ06_012127 [Nelumbo nucifera]